MSRAFGLWAVVCCLVALAGCRDKKSNQNGQPGKVARPPLVVRQDDAKAVLETFAAAEDRMDLAAAVGCFDPAVQPIARDVLAAGREVKTVLRELRKACVAKSWPHEADLVRDSLDGNVWLIGPAITKGQIDWDELAVTAAPAGDDKATAKVGQVEFELAKIQDKWYIRPPGYSPAAIDAYRAIAAKDQKDYQDSKAALDELLADLRSGNVKQAEFAAQLKAADEE